MLVVLEKIHRELMYLSSILSVQIEDHHYEAIADAVTARQHTWSCSKGQIFEKSSCSKYVNILCVRAKTKQFSGFFLTVWLIHL